MLTRKQKKQIVSDLKDRFSRLKLAVLTNYQGLKVSEFTELKNELEKAGVQYSVLKNTLIKRALKNSDIQIDPEIFTGPMAIAFGYDDEVMPAKIIANFAKNYETLKILGGIFEKRYIDETAIKNLAAIPDREQLYGQLVGVTAGPLEGMVNVLKSNLRSLVYILGQYQKQIS